jgi:RNA polymerase sigma-70 factor (ECF subfamily)
LHYARRVAVRTALGARRSHRAGARRLALAVDHASAEPPAATIAPADAIEREQRLEAFRRLLDELPEGQAESLTYRVLLEHPLDVIARATGVPVNTVRSRIRLARDHLRERILHDPTLSELLKEPS